ncbi:MAG: hypothetical protein FWD41_04820 [Actinomycetia bacterium]|nr:hypothetical protein [Actinomycetes bacterium]
MDRYVTARIERSEDPMLRAEETAGLITDDETLADVWKRADKPTFDLNDPEGFATYLRTQYAL